MCLKLSPCLIALFNKTGITGMLSQHQWLGNLALLLSKQSKRLWRGNLSLKHWREFSSGYYSSCASSSAAVRITWQTQIISVLTEHRALLVAVTSSERNKVSVCLLEVPSCCSNSLQSPQFLRAEHAQWERLGKERLRKGALKFWGGWGWFHRAVFEGVWKGGSGVWISLCVSWSLGAASACTSLWQLPLCHLIVFGLQGLHMQA